MRDLTGLLKRLATSWRGDLLAAVILVAWTLAWLGLIAAPQDRRWTVLIFALPSAAALVIRRRRPVIAAAVACAALLVLLPLGLAHVTAGLLTVPWIWTPFVLAYSLGTGTRVAVGLAGAALLAVSLQLTSQGSFNPIFEMMTAGPWLAGRIMLSRRTMTRQLAARNEELQAEQELFALESVRYERARIARELHDIVAHCLSVMVVQATAGQRVADVDPAGIEEALESVAEAAAQAQTEIGRLVELLGGDTPSGPPVGLQLVDELVRRANVTGLAVSCRFVGNCDRLTAAGSEATYRVVQEALTNALKHAPGATVDITIRGHGANVAVAVVNAAPHSQPSGLERSGGTYGLAGMRDRVSACGGSLTSGPTETGGWHVSALLPASGP